MKLNFSIKNRQDLDALWESLDQEKVKSPDNVWVNNPFKAVFLRFKALLDKILSSVSTKLPNTLGELSFRAYIMCCQTDSPSDFLGIIEEDLGIRSTSADNSVRLFFHWRKQIGDITKKLEAAQPNIKHDGMQSAIWSQVNEHHKMPSFLFVLDSMAKRFGISYEDVYNMKVQDIIIASTIDCINAEFQSRVDDMQLQKMKRKK